jgi:hypothetical protein
LRALNLELFTLPSNFDFLQVHQDLKFKTVHQIADLTYIDINGTMVNASTASNTLNSIPILVHIVFELVHEPLANPLHFGVSGIVA